VLGLGLEFRELGFKRGINGVEDAAFSYSGFNININF
jgi:hypothetical protein